MGRNKFSQALNVKTSYFGVFPSILHNISEFYTIHPQELAFSRYSDTTFESTPNIYRT